MLEMHFFIILMVWSYIQVVKTGPGYLSPSIVEKLFSFQFTEDPYRMNNSQMQRE